MKKIQRIFLLVILLCLVFASTVTVLAESTDIKFSDVPQTHWGYSAITEMTKRGLFSGTTVPVDGVGTFEPDKPMTRAAFITVITRELYPEEVASAEGGNEWWSPYYNVALEKGLVTETELFL